MSTVDDENYFIGTYITNLFCVKCAVKIESDYEVTHMACTFGLRLINGIHTYYGNHNKHNIR